MRSATVSGNLILHLNGNVRQWLVASFNRQEDHRERPREFAEREMIPAARLLAQLDATLLVEIAIERWSAKTREGGPKGPLDEDATAPGTCGVVSL